ncbi:MAG: hypothetical protein AAB425_16000, partial [Bdellovibrionota bacterium]
PGVANHPAGSTNERGIVVYYVNNTAMTENLYDSTTCSTNCAAAVYVDARGYATTEMKDVGTYLRSPSWDFKTVWTTPGQVYTGQYPVLQWEPGQSALPTTFASGSGGSVDPYVVATAAHLYSIMIDSTKWSNASISLSADIDFGGGQLGPIGNATTNFSGTFDGGKHVISNVKILGTVDDDNMGFIGYGAATSKVSNLILSGITVTGGFKVGGAAGYSEGTIQKVAVQGT